MQDYNTDEFKGMRERGDEKRRIYNLYHQACPACNGTKYATTYMGFTMSDLESHRDENNVECQGCGWKGITHDLDPAINGKLMVNTKIKQVLTCGEPGADEAWMNVADVASIPSIMFTFHGHREAFKSQEIMGFPPTYRYVEIHNLTLADLKAQEPSIYKAKDRLRRGLKHYTSVGRSMIARRAHAILEADMTVAVVNRLNVESGIVAGEVGWTVEFSRMAGLTTYVYSQASRIWWFIPILGSAYPLDRRPELSGRVAAVGDRNLTPKGEREILACITNTIVS